MTRSRFLHVAAAAVGILAAPGAASAQAYPTRPIQVIVPFAGGSASDVVMRILLDRMGKSIGQPFVVDNRPGAGGTIGARAVAESDPDGYTLLLGNTSTLIISPLVYRQVNYDPVKGFAPVALLGTTSNVLIVNPALPAKAVQDLIARPSITTVHAPQ